MTNCVTFTVSGGGTPPPQTCINGATQCNSASNTMEYCVNNMWVPSTTPCGGNLTQCPDPGDVSWIDTAHTKYCSMFQEYACENGEWGTTGGICVPAKIGTTEIAVLGIGAVLLIALLRG